MKDHTLRIDRRFRGPPESGNGGYVCGRLGRLIDGPAIVRLRVPPPLETDLAIRDEEDGVALYDGELRVAEGRPTTVEVEPPTPPTYQEAVAAGDRYRGFEHHTFPTCFVCGPERREGDGLRIFAGPLEGRDLVAAPWTPSESVGDGTGRVAPEFLWAVLDCPGAYSFPAPEGGALVLGELAVDIRGEVAVGERCVVVARENEKDGRRHWTTTALFGPSGDCRAVGRGTWFEVGR